MTALTVLDPAYPTTPDEKAFAIIDAEGDLEIEIHPMDRNGADYRDHSVTVVLGSVGAFRSEEDRTDEFFIISVDRDEFVEGLLATFSELRRA